MDDRETEIEILAEGPALTSSRRSRLVAATTRTSILIMPIAADALELAVLEHAQQLRLQVDVELADLVEEDGAAVRLLEAAVMLSDGAGERALLVAEQRRLDQLLRDRAAVEHDERLAACASTRWWMPRAIISLPVPVSPVMSTVSSDGATFSSVAKISRMRTEAPVTDSKRVALRQRDLDDVLRRREAQRRVADAKLAGRA